MMARRGSAPTRAGRLGLRARLRSVGAAVVALALLIGPPLVLVWGVGNPLADMPHSLGEVQQWWDQRYLPADAVMGALTLVLWLLWTQYVWALLWEVFVAGPRAARGRVGRQAPGVPRFTRSLVTSLVSGVMSAGLVASTAGPALTPLVSAVMPSAGPVASLVAEAMGATSPTPAAAPMAPIAGQPHLYQVQATDSLWRLAGQDDAMLKRILELNEDQIRTPVDLRPGMVLRLPDGLDTPAPAPGPGGPIPSVGGGQPHVVERGDNLWELTEAQLAATGTQDPTNAQIVDQLERVVDANTPPIVDPDLIYPGQVVVLPPVGGQVAEQIPPAPLEAGPSDAAPAPAPGGEVAAEGAIGAGGSAAEGAIGAAGPGADAGGAAAALLDEIDRMPVAPVTPAAASGTTSADPVAVGRLEVMAVAAAAMLGMVGTTRRRRRAAFGFAPPAPAGPARDFVDQLAAAADPGLTLWAAAQLHPLVQVAAGITTIGLSSTQGLEVTWDAEPELTIDGWTAVDPRRWQRPYPGPDIDAAHLPPVALPGLVTLGERREGDSPSGPQVLVDLAAIGSLSVSGPPERVASTVRAMVYELGLGEHLSNAYLTTVGFTVGDAGQLDRVARRSEEDALALAREAVDRHGRLDRRLGPRELDVLVVRTEHTNLNPFLDLAGRRAGVALIVAGDVRSSRIGARLELADDGTARYRPTTGDSIEAPLVAAALTRAQEQQLTALLASAAAPPVNGPAVGDQDEARLRARARGAARWAGAGRDSGDLLVHLLGPVRCPDVPDLQAHALSLVAYLAVQPGRTATTAQLAAALWGDRTVSPHQVTRVIDAARAALGPERLPDTGLEGELMLRGVGTDLEILHGLLEAPAGAASGEAVASGLGLISGPPLGGAPLRWAGDTDLADYAGELVEAVVLHIVEGAQRSGDTELANLAVHQGLAALPTSERIYRAWMRLATAEGDPALIESIWRSLRSALAAGGGAPAGEGGAPAGAGAGVGGHQAELGAEPTAETRAVYEGLLRSVIRRREPVGG
ncbi:MAG: LysM peptidoglycan-binding domain-containing protein [Acidimicrobiales bacterium]